MSLYFAALLITLAIAAMVLAIVGVVLLWRWADDSYENFLPRAAVAFTASVGLTSVIVWLLLLAGGVEAK